MNVSTVWFFYPAILVNSDCCTKQGEGLSCLGGCSNYKPALTANPLPTDLSVWDHFFTGANSVIRLWMPLRSKCYSDAIAGLMSTASCHGEEIQSQWRLTFTSFSFWNAANPDIDCWWRYLARIVYLHDSCIMYATEGYLTWSALNGIQWASSHVELQVSCQRWSLLLLVFVAYRSPAWMESLALSTRDRLSLSVTRLLCSSRKCTDIFHSIFL